MICLFYFVFVQYGLPAAVQWPFGGLAVGLELAVGGMGGVGGGQCLGAELGIFY